MENIIKKFKILKTIKIENLSVALKIKDLYDNDKIILIKSEWGEHTENNQTPLDLKQTDKWNTSDRCANLTIKYVDDNIIVDIRLWDCYTTVEKYSYFSIGDKKDTRWTASFNIPNDFVLLFDEEIDMAYTMHVHRICMDDFYENINKRELEISNELLNK